uniref:Si:ch1073-390k14.1 n=1 Tax=Cyprinus carpio TaxID=7962 RepID=A0A8C1YND9_CYPCA
MRYGTVVYVKNIFCMLLFQDEADELELALKLLTSGVDQPNVFDGAVVAENQTVAKLMLDTEVHKTTCAIKNSNKDNDDLKVTQSTRSQRRHQRKKQHLLKNPSGPRPVLLWFRRDLRMWDNPALIGCLELDAPVIPVFLWNGVEEEGPGVTVAAGGASKYWLHQTLLSLSRSLEKCGSHLVTLKAEASSLTALQESIAETGPWLKERDDSVWEALEKQGVTCHMYHSYCLRDPYTVSTRGAGLRGIISVSHFMSCCQQNPVSGLTAPLDGCPLVDLGLARMPRRKDGLVILVHQVEVNVFYIYFISDNKNVFKDFVYFQFHLYVAILNDQSWSSDPVHLKAWQRGRTGYPLVDAAMRQLWQTGWMNNYMRHVVASFLIAYLHIPWQEGYRWFQVRHQHPANNTPWQKLASMLRRAGVVLGSSYPERIIIDLDERRAQSLQDVASVRRHFREFVRQRSGYDMVPVPARLVQEALGSMEDVVCCEGTGFLLLVITCMEFKHHSEDPDRQHNPYSAVLKGYFSRKRDKTIAFLNEGDFTASVMFESAQCRERVEKDWCLLEGLP